MISFNNSPTLYWAGVFFLFTSTALLTITPSLPDQRFKKNGIIWIALLFQLLLLVYLRLPIIVFNEALNPDENLFIVGAMTLAESPLYWESVDGCTSGPFNFYIVTIFCEVFDQPYDYISARMIGIILLMGSFFFSFLALRTIFNASIALLSLFPAVAFMGLTKHWDFVNFSSEHLPMFLLSIMLYLFVSIYKSKLPINKIQIFVFGLMAGCVIFTKLQAIPIAFCLTLIGYWLIYPKQHNHDLLKNAIILTTGGVLPIVVLVLIGYKYNFLDKIWIFYIENNLAYGKESYGLIHSIYVSLSDPINFFIRATLVLSIILLIYHVLFKRQLMPTMLGSLMALFILSTIVSVYKTGFMFHHYLLFLVFPVVFLFAFLLNDVAEYTKNYIIIGLSILATIYTIAQTSTILFSNYFISSDKPQRPLSVSKTGHQILKYSHPDESLVVWGDAGRLYLETKRTQGVRWSNSHWGMYSDSLQKNFQKEFIMELKEKPFPVFVDAHPTKNTFMTRDKLGYETNKELKEHIDSNYQLIGEFDEQRVFVHKERLIEMNATK
ncbi:hypothetical protein GCM10011514_38510 [Emticicia aquatilis]|uniref:Uncharacterized protein n=1 Tax=Emticicia aquatilis TaxID=1537369 RepID=A0A916Z0W9_9BACT|nr:hypothetical protein [Emticicia aquatilis]GGD70726.1 hypothetical protein GCM10011514_38510 [Emticicia aquatilis]